jgi:membrane-associated protease RseP (regulator of RpoE activity)
MGRIVGIVVAFLAGLVVATLASWLQVPEPPPLAVRPADGEARVRDLERRLARETAARAHAEQQLAELTERLAASDERDPLPPAPPPAAPAPHQPAPAAAPAAPPAVAAAPPPDPVAAGAAAAEVARPEPTAVDYSKSELERALIAGGMEPYKAADLKRRADTLALAEMYLRDQASREGWIDTPRFQEELASLQQQQVSFRDELGDEGYDKYLYALGQTNRVRVDDVMTDSPAAQAGLAPGDQILRYGDTRIFAPEDLVEQTRQGEPGEMVPLLVIRQGNVISVEVPRGPLGLRVNATQSNPRRNDGQED